MWAWIFFGFGLLGIGLIIEGIVFRIRKRDKL